VSISENLAAIHERIRQAAIRSGRDPEQVTLMAVTKTHPPRLIIEAYNAGQRLFGENRVQEFAQKIDAVRGLLDADFHMIGHLQSNKAGKATEIFHAIDSLDSAKLGDRLNAAAVRLDKRVEVLIEINVGGEEAKSGIAPESSELEGILRATPSWSHLRLWGLMTVPPFTEHSEGARPYFRKLRKLRDQLAARNLPGITLDQLSMGMSHDFEVAIEEGSTCVRVGTAIFGEREKGG
jgi:hypothetical protein